MKRVVTSFGILALVFTAAPAFAEIVEVEPTPYYENEPTYQDNTGALGTGDTAANITETETQVDVSGAVEGEITLHRISSGIEVFSSLNKVELIEKNSDGWVGAIDDGGSTITFKPAGRPELKCPHGDATDWYGPCKIEEE